MGRLIRRAWVGVLVWQAFHLGAMLVMAVLYSHGRPRDTPAASWRSLRSPHGLYVADLLSHCVALSKRWSALPSFAPNHLVSASPLRPSMGLYRIGK
jgi:hypothetical protein